MVPLVKLVWFAIFIIFLLSESEARRLIESDDSGSGDRTWAMEQFYGNAQVQSTSGGRTVFKVGNVIHVKFETDPVPVVQLVTKDEYEGCRSAHPIRVLNTIDAAFKLDRPGLFYFINGVFEDCMRGQKEVIEVSP